MKLKRVFVVESIVNEIKESKFFTRFMTCCNLKILRQKFFFESYFNHLTKYFTSRFLINFLDIMFSISKNLIKSESSFINNDDENVIVKSNLKSFSWIINIIEWIFQCFEIFKRYAKFSIFSVILNESTYCCDSFFLKLSLTICCNFCVIWKVFKR